ncbi:MAG: hypothetical protein JO348_09975 [Alphaproteobacteria bacterium]|nr:hypothetical protein [Alphaproteobacteria bacterium]
MVSFRKSAATLLAAVFSVAVANAASPAPTVKQMQDSLAHKGAKATLAAYFDCDTGTGYKLIDEGDAGAVKLAFALLPVAHGCQWESIAFSISHAMTTNPTVTMGLLAQHDILDPCVPGMNNETPPRTLAILDDAQRAYESVTDPALAKVKQKCLAELKEFRAAQPTH